MHQRDEHMKHDESGACWKTPGLAGSTIPDSGAPGPAESGSEAAFGFAACDSVPPEIQTTLLQFRQQLRDPFSWMSSYWTTKGGRAARGEKSIQYTEPILSAQLTCSLSSWDKDSTWFPIQEQIPRNKAGHILVPSMAGLISIQLPCQTDWF